MSKIKPLSPLEEWADKNAVNAKQSPVVGTRDFQEGQKRVCRKGPITKDYIIDNCKLDAETGCWIWNRAVSKCGRPVTRIGKRSCIVVSRIVWALWYEQPENLLVCHRCDNPLCCNPSHLFLGTPKDNTQDCMKKKRWWTRKKISSMSVINRNLIQRVEKEAGTYEQIASRTGVSETTVWRIKKMKVGKSLLEAILEDK